MSATKIARWNNPGRFVVLRRDEVKILFLAANPVDVATRLRPDVEFREIDETIRRSKLGDRVELVLQLAVRPGDLQAALERHKPDVVHFSGHCSPSGEVILEDEAGNRKVVSTEAFVGLFRILKGNVRVVVLNACHGKEQARALTEVIDFAVGMNTAIDDKAAIAFASGFYQWLASGRSVKESFELAVNRSFLNGWEGANAPELFARDGLSAGGSFSGKLTGRRVLGFLPWLLASNALALITDVGRRFLGDGWPEVAASIFESLFVVASALAASLMVISVVSPLSRLAQRFPDLHKTGRAIALTGIGVIIALAIWLARPMVARYYNERGFRFQYREQRDASRARQSYQLAVRLNPSYAQAHYNLASVLEDLQPEQAIEEYLLAIRHDMWIYPAYNNLARLYLRRGRDGDYETALSLLNRAVDLSPEDNAVRYSLNKNLGWANYALKHYSLAEIYLRRAISLRGEQGGAAAHCLLAYVLKEQGKPGVAQECFDCVSLSPGEADVEPDWLSSAKDCVMVRGNQ
jgi:hypothetical protein